MNEAAMRHAPLTILTVHPAIVGYFGSMVTSPADLDLTEQTQAAVKVEADKVLAGHSGPHPESVAVRAAHGYGALTVDAQRQVGQRVVPVRVAAVLADQQLETERPHNRRHHGVEGPQPARVPGAGRQRDVDRRPVGMRAAGLIRPAGAGKQRVRVVVQADGQQPRTSQNTFSTPSP
jgi:hypothetical protein